MSFRLVNSSCGIISPRGAEAGPPHERANPRDGCAAAAWFTGRPPTSRGAAGGVAAEGQRGLANCPGWEGPPQREAGGVPGGWSEGVRGGWEKLRLMQGVEGVELEPVLGPPPTHTEMLNNRFFKNKLCFLFI